MYNLYYDIILQGRNFKFSEKIDERSRIILLVHIRKLDFFYYHTNLILSFDAKVVTNFSIDEQKEKRGMSLANLCLFQPVCL